MRSSFRTSNGEKAAIVFHALAQEKENGWSEAQGHLLVLKVQKEKKGGDQKNAKD